LGVYRLDELADGLARIGESIGLSKKGQQLSKRFHARLADLRYRYQSRTPVNVFYQVWEQPLYTVDGPQIITDALHVCGGSNVFADLHQAALQIDAETVLARNPEVILATNQAQLAGWQQWPRWRRWIVNRYG
jgi:ABC-type Fe3+-hydroxamate transport system substrate-binding protein